MLVKEKQSLRKLAPVVYEMESKLKVAESEFSEAFNSLNSSNNVILFIGLIIITVLISVFFAQILLVAALGWAIFIALWFLLESRVNETRRKVDFAQGQLNRALFQYEKEYKGIDYKEYIKDWVLIDGVNAVAFDLRCSPTSVSLIASKMGIDVPHKSNEK